MELISSLLILGMIYMYVKRDIKKSSEAKAKYPEPRVKQVSGFNPTAEQLDEVEEAWANSSDDYHD